MLAQLVNKSLVLVEAGPIERRYRLVETLREYGQERLEKAGDEHTVRARHLAWAHRLAQRAYGPIWGSEQGVWFGLLHAEHENLRAAIDWSKLAVRQAAPGAVEAAGAVHDLARYLWRF